jgi:hypothetical protein
MGTIANLIEAYHLRRWVACKLDELRDPPRRSPRQRPSAEELRRYLRMHEGCVLAVARSLDRRPALIYRWCDHYGIVIDDFRLERRTG